MCMCHGSGATWFCFCCRSDVSWLGPIGTGRSAQVLRSLQILETALEQLDRALSKVPKGIALSWTTVTTTIGQMVDTRVLGKVDKWNSSGKAWPKWSFVMKAYDVAVDQRCQVHRTVRVVSSVQLGGVQLYVVLIMLRTGRDWNRIANALRGWSTEAWRFLFQTYSPKSDARLVVLMMLVLAVLLDTNDVVAEASDAMDVDVILKRSSKGASESSGRNRDSAFVCWYFEKRQ